MNLHRGIVRLPVLVILLLGIFAAAKEQTFNFKDPKGVNSIGIFLDSKLEPIRGYARGISGTVTFDLEKPTVIKGEIEVSAKSIEMTNPLMTRTLHGSEWIDVDKFPTVKAIFTKLISAERVSDTLYKMKVEGTFTLKGVTKNIAIPIEVSYFKGARKARGARGKGDLIVVRTRFSINRVDFGIKPELSDLKVARMIQFDIAIVGYSK